MPIYEYQCDDCGHRMEAIHKITESPLRDCPACRRQTLRKLVSAAAFKLTGSGWYETDFKNAKKQQASDKATQSDGNKTAQDGGQKNGGKTQRAEDAQPPDKVNKDKTGKKSSGSAEKSQKQSAPSGGGSG